MFSTTDTIVAIATPPGRGGVGVVRLSGQDACAIAMRLLGRDLAFTPRYATVGRILAPGRGSRALDEVVATWFQAPRSYTREDVVEIAAHGSPVVLGQIVALSLEAGARLAEPGEFTLRAYLHGRLDLVQAEAVGDLVDAVTPAQARAAMDQLEGTLSARLTGINDRVFDLIARLEASLDFPEEGFHFLDPQKLGHELASIGTDIAGVLREGRSGRLLREGATVVLIGRPNAGKSSVFNAMVGAARAIVSDLPGTTRDMVTERVDLSGVPVTLVDTAGLRAARDVVEAEGIRRALAATQVATLVLEVIDAAEHLNLAQRAEIPAERRALVVWNKCDLLTPETRVRLGEEADGVMVSCVSGEGIDTLKELVLQALTEGERYRDPPGISNLRQIKLLELAASVVERSGQLASSGATEEVVLAELSAAREALEGVTGRTTDEDVLRHIFANFCIGK